MQFLSKNFSMAVTLSVRSYRLLCCKNFVLKYFRRTSTLRKFFNTKIFPTKISYNKNFPIYGSCEGNHILAILKEPENYDSLMKGLACRLEKWSSTFESNWCQWYYLQNKLYHGRRLKFLVIVTGIDSAKADFACIWCKCPKSQQHIIDKVWSISDVSHGARTLSKKRKKEFNVSHEPLFPSIPLTHVVIDNLHMFLRISDVLIDLLILELKHQDCIDKVYCIWTTEIQTFGFLSELCLISWYTWLPILGREKLKGIRSLTGPEQLKLLKVSRSKSSFLSSMTLKC